MATIIDSYSETNQDTQKALGYSQTRIGQSFTGNGYTLTSAKFYLKINSGSPTGNITCKLYAHSGTFGTSSVPTGSALDTSGTYDIAGLTSSYQLIEFTFSGGYTVVNGTHYFIEVDYSGGGPLTNISVGMDGSSPSHAGNYWDDNNGVDLSIDTCFYVYGVAPATNATITGVNTITGLSTLTL